MNDISTHTSRAHNQFTPIEKRFDEKYVVEANSGCWLWTGSVRSGRDDRPILHINGKPVLAYRYAFERFVGPIPEGRMICHKCNVPTCVNPDHVYAGTAKDNMRDCLNAGNHVSQTDPVGTRERARRLGRRPKPKGIPSKARIVPLSAIPVILARHDAGEDWASISRDYGISRVGMWGLGNRALKRRQALATARGSV